MGKIRVAVRLSDKMIRCALSGKGLEAEFLEIRSSFGGWTEAPGTMTISTSRASWPPPESDHPSDNKSGTDELERASESSQFGTSAGGGAISAGFKEADPLIFPHRLKHREVGGLECAR